jgi:SAM-dependent methyltransferase
VDERALIEAWTTEERAHFAGWDFSRISTRLVEESPPWSYESLARAALHGAASLLDLGTGGGEVLTGLKDAFPPRVVATEAYVPNVPIARSRLEPLGVTVVPYDADETRAPLPFPSESFDVVLSRHEAYEATEVARILRHGGTFLTQQVDAQSLADLRALFGVGTKWPWVTLDNFVGDLRAAGLVVEDAQRWTGTAAFRDVGALVYFLKSVPWEVPGFTVERYKTVLVALQRKLEERGSLEFRSARFVIQARRDGHE